MRNAFTELFSADIRQKMIKESCARSYPQLPAEEREKADRFLREDDRLRFITGRLMIRKAAAEKAGIGAPEILLTGYGKPYIAGADGFNFNLSHSGDLVVLAVSGSPVGVDIERNDPIEWREISAAFGAKEREMLENADEPLKCFYRIWTVREAFAKAIGTGLQLFDDEQPDIDYDRGTVNYRGRTMYTVSREWDGYTLSLCSAAPLGDRDLSLKEMFGQQPE